MNVTTPGALAVGDIVGPIDYVGDLYVDGDWLYVVCGDGTGYGLWKYDITDPTSITYYSSDYWYDCAIPYGVSIMGDWGYIMGYKLDNSTHPDTFSTIGVFDVMDKVKFVCDFNFMRQLMRRLHKNGETMLYTVGRYFDGSGFVGAARAIRVGYPDSCVFEPGEIVYYSIGYGHPRGDSSTLPSQIEVRGDFAFVVDEIGMAAINIKRPDTLKFMREFVNTNHRFFGINVAGDCAFLTSDDPNDIGYNLWIMDIKDPYTVSSYFPVLGGASSGLHANIAGEVKIEGNVAYTVSEDSLGPHKKRIFMDAFDITNVRSPLWLSSDSMLYLQLTHTAWWLYNDYFCELQIEGDTAYVSWRTLPYPWSLSMPRSMPWPERDSITNHIGLFDVSNPSNIYSFVPRQQIIDPGTGSILGDTTWNLGFTRAPCGYSGGAIDVEGNIMYSLIGSDASYWGWNSIPVFNSIPHFGLIRYRIDTTYGGYIDTGIHGSGYSYQNVWINDYRPLTDNGYPLELYVDGDYLFCSFDWDLLYFMRVDSVDNYNPQYNIIPIYNSNFNDFKPAGDYLYAVGETLISLPGGGYTQMGRFWAIRVYRRNHCVFAGTYKLSSLKRKNTNENLMECYPNPFNKIIKISINVSNTFGARIHIYDIKGNLIWTGEINPKNKEFYWVPPNSLESGIYIVEFSKGKISAKQKVVFIK